MHFHHGGDGDKKRPVGPTASVHRGRQSMTQHNRGVRWLTSTTLLLDKHPRPLEGYGQVDATTAAPRMTPSP